MKMKKLLKMVKEEAFYRMINNSKCRVVLEKLDDLVKGE